MTRVLLALVAPGSVEAEIGRLQQSIFRDHGLVSSVALPPLVPVAFLPDAARLRGFLPRLNAIVGAPYCMTLRGLSSSGGWLYLDVDSGGVWAALRDAVLSATSRGDEELFPTREGFFLGGVEASPEQRAQIQLRLPYGKFSSACIAVMRMEIAEGEAWWRQVTMETLEEAPLRGKRR